MSGRFEGTRAVVVGLATSGLAAAGALAAQGADVRVSEARAADTVDRSGLDPSIELLAGGHRPEHLDGATLVVTSPGVPQDAPILRWAAAHQLPVWPVRNCVIWCGLSASQATSVQVCSARIGAPISARYCGQRR